MVNSIFITVLLFCTYEFSLSAYMLTYLISVNITVFYFLVQLFVFPLFSLSNFLGDIKIYSISLFFKLKVYVILSQFKMR